MIANVSRKCLNVYLMSKYSLSKLNWVKKTNEKQLKIIEECVMICLYHTQLTAYCYLSYSFLRPSSKSMHSRDNKTQCVPKRRMKMSLIHFILCDIISPIFDYSMHWIYLLSNEFAMCTFLLFDPILRKLLCVCFVCLFNP